MVNVDISNIWGELSLPELLSIEQEVSAAHLSLDNTPWQSCSSGELLRLLAVAEHLRNCSQVCVVVGNHPACAAAKACLELLQGQQRNLTRGEAGDPQIFFAGNSFSTRQWNQLRQQLEGKDFSLICAADTELAPEAAVTLRNLKWMLDRRYGTDEASRRICAVTHPEEGTLCAMAQLHNWELLPMSTGDGYAALSPATLLILAVAGLDAAGFLAGAVSTAEELQLRSFENPLWLYAAVRILMDRRGKKGELLVTWEPDALSLGRWWQQQFALEARDCPGSLTSPALWGEDRVLRPGLHVTALRFAPSGQECPIPSDVHDTDGINTLAGKNLEDVQDQTFLDALDAWADAGIPVLTLECEILGETALGELFSFLAMAGALSARILRGPEEIPAE